MARIDFYVLTGSGEPAQQRFACRLAEKAYRHNNTVHIEIADPASVRTMNEMLWTFRDGSFVPHDILEPGAGDIPSPVTIGTRSPAQKLPDLVINLTNAMPEGRDTFARIAEIVTSDDSCKVRSRQKFASYREDGHSLETHKI